MIRAYGSAPPGVTSGVGLAMAKTIASSAMRESASAGMTRAPDRPTNRSAPAITSAAGRRGRAGQTDEQVRAVDHLGRRAVAALRVGRLGEPALDRVHRPVQVVVATGV